MEIAPTPPPPPPPPNLYWDAEGGCVGVGLLWCPPWRTSGREGAELAAEGAAATQQGGAWVCMVAWRLMYWINSQVSSSTAECHRDPLLTCVYL